jgi:alpha-galactosidase
MQAAYQKMGEALQASGRAIAYAVAAGGQSNIASWAPKTGANIWRAGKDIEETWQSMLEGSDAFNGTEAAEPGQWSDPGLLQVGNGGMTSEEYRAHLNLWAVLGGPMVLGNDVRIMRKETVDLLSNQEVLAITQDTAALQGRRVAQTGSTEAWAKQLADGSTAIVFINRGNTSAPAAVSWQQLGIMGPRLVRDLWWHENIGTANNRYSAFLTAHTSLLVRLSPP